MIRTDIQEKIKTKLLNNSLELKEFEESLKDLYSCIKILLETHTSDKLKELEKDEEYKKILRYSSQIYIPSLIPNDLKDESFLKMLREIENKKDNYSRYLSPDSRFLDTILGNLTKEEELTVFNKFKTMMDKLIKVIDLEKDITNIISSSLLSSEIIKNNIPGLL